jgi:16S rRNA (guanine527-N7)-methyltransferase
LSEATGPDRSLSALRALVGAEVGATLRRAAERGFLGDASVESQIDHALGFVYSTEVQLGRSPTTAVDLGTGGGTPGLVMGACWPSSRVVLMDASQRRTDFLNEEVGGWDGWTGVAVVRGRAEELARDERFRGGFELATARSFGPPAVTAECGAALLVPGGVMVVSEPPGGEAGRRWPEEGLAELGLSLSAWVRFAGRFGYQVLVKSGPTPDRYPRRVGIPAKRPLF